MRANAGIEYVTKERSLTLNSQCCYAFHSWFHTHKPTGAGRLPSRDWGNVFSNLLPSAPVQVSSFLLLSFLSCNSLVHRLLFPVLDSWTTRRTRGNFFLNIVRLKRVKAKNTLSAHFPFILVTCSLSLALVRELSLAFLLFRSLSTTAGVS